MAITWASSEIDWDPEKPKPGRSRFNGRFTLPTGAPVELIDVWITIPDDPTAMPSCLVYLDGEEEVYDLVTGKCSAIPQSLVVLISPCVRETQRQLAGEILG